MSQDRTERLIRQAFAAEADRAVDPAIVLAELERRRAKPARHRTTLVFAAAAVVVAALVAALVVPNLLREDTPPVGATAVADQNILVIGEDDGGYADSIALTHVGTDGSSALISIPRDSLVSVPGLGMRKLSTTLPEGPQTLIAAVEGLTGVHIDHYVLFTMAAFDRISTAAGGVPVCLNQPVPPFPSGVQVLSGRQALEYLRQRHGLPYGDLDRMVRLQTFAQTLAAKLISQGRIADVRLLTLVRDNVRVDAGWNLLDAAGLLKGLRATDMRTGTIPLHQTDSLNPGALEVDPAQVQPYVRNMIESPAKVTTAPTAPATTSKAATSRKSTTAGAPATAEGLRVPCVN